MEMRIPSGAGTTLGGVDVLEESDNFYDNGLLGGGGGRTIFVLVVAQPKWQRQSTDQKSNAQPTGMRRPRYSFASLSSNRRSGRSGGALRDRESDRDVVRWK